MITEYKTTDTVTLTGTEMNHIIKMFSRSANKQAEVELIFKEKMYCKKILDLKNKLAQSEWKRSTAERKANQLELIIADLKSQLRSIEKEMTIAYENLLNERKKSYEKGTKW